jgi:hypothetical protein
MAKSIDPFSLSVANPFRPGAGHTPPHLAGREEETKEFAKMLEQATVIHNLVLTGLRGVGKTVLMDHVYKPLAISKHWAWVGSDLSESSFVNERTLCNRLITDLSLYTSQLSVDVSESKPGFQDQTLKKTRLDYETLIDFFSAQPGLMVDKMKATLEMCWKAIELTGKKGIVFAYDESQVVQDRKDKDEYPLAMMLECFQSVQRKGMMYMLLLTGLPTLFPKLVESRTYAERMFVVQEIGRLTKEACTDAIVKPLKGNQIQFAEHSVSAIVEESACYPYFIQFICREAYDYFKASLDAKPNVMPSIPLQTLVRKLDADFFSGRWGRVTDRQRELLLCIASLKNQADEFSINEIVAASVTVAKKENTIKSFKAGDVAQMLPKLVDCGLVYKNRHGKYSFAVPQFGAYILRQFAARKSHQPSLWDE